MNTNPKYAFRYKVSREVLCNYLAKTVTLSCHHTLLNAETESHRKQFILNTGAKYIQRADTCWNPRIDEYTDYPMTKAFIDDVHKEDPDVVFEACVFETVTKKLVNEIPIPAWVFLAYGLEPEKRNFDYDKMIFPNGKYVNHWTTDQSVPDMTQLETQMFFYYRSCTYITLGYEALHLGQVHLVGEDDINWECWTKLCKMIREFATKYARRNFVFINAHTCGIIGSDGKLLFDFHAEPARPMADPNDVPHPPTEDNPQRCYLSNEVRGDFKIIYGHSLGGMTYSGWECDSLPYLVEIDNFGDVYEQINIPDPTDVRCWGMDEINWFANQPAWYRAEFMKYAYNWMRTEAKGEGYFAFVGERVCSYYNENKEVVGHYYYAYDPAYFEGGNNDEAVIKEIFSNS